jgi:hypothetical protein
MTRIIRSRRSADRPQWWSTVLVGAALGAVAAWLVLRGGAEAEPAPAQPRGTPREPDLDAMAARLARVPGTGELRLRSLGGGILELVGSAAPNLDVPALLAALAMEPRVTVVVNRVWTPDAPGAPGVDESAFEASEPADAQRPKPATS